MNKGTEARWVGKDRPTCDICQHLFAREGVPALYDGCVVGQTSWANMCAAHFTEYGVGLGTGKGQKLIFKDEASV